MKIVFETYISFVVYGYHMQIRTKLRNMKIMKLNLTGTFIWYNAV